jgi:hypothetical protein
MLTDHDWAAQHAVRGLGSGRDDLVDPVEDFVEGGLGAGGQVIGSDRRTGTVLSGT